MDTRLIKLFNAALVENNTSNEMFKRVNELAVKVGYFVHPDVCNQSVIDFLHEVEINPNATFYKTWEDIISRDRIELAIDQILHYTTTYGSDFSMGNGFTRNDGDNDAPLLDFKNYKVIMPITESELGKRCYDMLCAGIALKKETMEAVADFVIGRVNSGAMIIDVDAIKNREGQIYICNKLNIWPNNPTSLFRMIMFMTTGNTMIVNNNETFNTIKASRHPFDFNKLNNNDLIALSSIFLRFKNLFLAFKHNDHAQGNKAVINKLRKLAIEYHKPFKAGFWQTVFSTPKTIEELRAHLDELTTYKKIALMQLCMEHYACPKDNLYLIRNGKQFFKVNEPKELTTKELKDKVYYATLVYTILKNSVIETLAANSQKEVIVADVETEGVEPTVMTTKVAKVVKVPTGMHVTLPASEKAFVGNYPFGTSFDLTRNNLIGCYWRNEWGTNDYDLSLVDINGHKIGWNASYYDTDKNVVYSGDMTNAAPEAAEIIKIANPEELKALIKINQYRGQSKSKFELFFGQSNKPFKYEAYKNYMVDPNDIKFRATIEHENKKEMQIALVGNNKITLMEIHSGNRIVSHSHSTQEDYIKALLNKTEWFVDAAEILKAAGFQIVDETYTGEVDIDFDNLEKDSLISLMA